LLFDNTGAACNSAIQKYVNQKQVPHLFLGTGRRQIWRLSSLPVDDGLIYAKYVLKEKPNAKIAILYQNDDFGKDYPAGMKDVLGDNFDKMVVTASYETTDPTVDSQLTSLQAAGADVLLVAASPKFATQAIRKVHDLDWKPLFFMTYTSTSIAAVINPAGPQNAIGIISAGFVKDQADPNSKKDTGMNEWRDFMAKYMPGADTTDGNYVFAYSISKAMLQVLKQCEGNFTT
jgi:branched-chain amino acid transport system substrate-binding protein